MTPSQKNEKALAALRLALTEVERLCSGERWRMTIPANEKHDSDIIISTALTLAIAALSQPTTGEDDNIVEPNRMINGVKLSLILNEFAQKVRLAKDIDEARAIIDQAEALIMPIDDAKSVHKLLSRSIDHQLPLDAVQAILECHGPGTILPDWAFNKLSAWFVDLKQQPAPLGGEVGTVSKADIQLAALTAEPGYLMPHNILDAIHALIQSRVGGRK